MKIAISAGHYPERPGACYGDFCEHSEALAWAKLIVEYLGDQGVLIPSGFLKDKVEAINKHQFDLAIEIHFNSAKNDHGEHIGVGCETLFYPGSEKGAYLASEVQTALTNTLFRDRGIKPGYYRMNKKNGPDFFLAKTDCPAIIVEPEFIQHKGRIQTSRAAACLAIADTLSGIVL